MVVIVAEELDTSSVVAVVVAGLYLGHRIPYLLSPTSRLQMDAVWRLIIFLLEGVVFLLVGLQLRELVSDLETGPGHHGPGHRGGLRHAGRGPVRLDVPGDLPGPAVPADPGPRAAAAARGADRASPGPACAAWSPWPPR